MIKFQSFITMTKKALKLAFRIWSIDWLIDKYWLPVTYHDKLTLKWRSACYVVLFYTTYHTTTHPILWIMNTYSNYKILLPLLSPFCDTHNYWPCKTICVMCLYYSMRNECIRIIFKSNFWKWSWECNYFCNYKEGKHSWVAGIFTITTIWWQFL